MDSTSEMTFPLGYSGTVAHQEAASRDQLIERLSVVLAAEGARDIELADNTLRFRGLTNTRSFSPLASIARGEIVIANAGSQLRLDYSIEIDRTPFVASIAAAVIGFTLVAVASERFFFLGVFGVGVLAVACAYSCLIRLRFPRWLNRALG